MLRENEENLYDWVELFNYANLKLSLAIYRKLLSI